VVPLLPPRIVTVPAAIAVADQVITASVVDVVAIFVPSTPYAVKRYVSVK